MKTQLGGDCLHRHITGQIPHRPVLIRMEPGMAQQAVEQHMQQIPVHGSGLLLIPLQEGKRLIIQAVSIGGESNFRMDGSLQPIDGNVQKPQPDQQGVPGQTQSLPCQFHRPGIFRRTDI